MLRKFGDVNISSIFASAFGKRFDNAGKEGMLKRRFLVCDDEKEF